MINQSIESTSISDGDFTFTEVIKQEYSNCKFSGGFVEGHPVDTLYIRMEKNGVITTELLLRPGFNEQNGGSRCF